MAALKDEYLEIIRDDPSILDSAIVREREFDAYLFALGRPRLVGALQRACTAEERPPPTTDDRPRRFRTLSEVDQRRPEYLWSPYIPTSGLTVVRGDSGSGKTWLVGKLAAEASQGGQMPNGVNGQLDSLGPPRPVLLLQKELDESSVVAPRMDGLGANLDLIVSPGPGELSPFLFGPDKEHLPAFLRLAWYIEVTEAEYGARPAFIYVDPITSFLDADPNVGKEVRPTLERLIAVSSHYQVPVIFVQHYNKSQGTSVKYRGSGSQEFTNAARSSIECREDRHDNDSDPYTSSLLAFHGKKLAIRGKNLGYTISGETLNPERPLHFAWREVDQDTTAEALAAEEAVAARNGTDRRHSMVETTRLAIVECLLQAGVEGHDTLTPASLKLAVMARGGESVQTTGTTWQRAYKGDPTRGIDPLPAGQPVEVRRGEWEFPTLKASTLQTDDQS